MSSHEFELLISSLLFEVKRSVDTSKTESRIRQHFESMMSDPQLLDLPLSVIAHVIRTDVDDIHSVFFFLKQCLDRFGSAGSVLFTNFEILKLNTEEICELENDAWLDWSVVGSRGGEQVVGLVSRCLQSERRVAALIAENDKLRRQMEDIIGEFIRCPTSGVAQRAMREAAQYSRGVSKASNSKKVGCSQNPINCSESFPCPLSREK
jgi:hypothetical protein